MHITQRFCKGEIPFVYMVDAIAADGFDVFSVCQGIDGVWHAWIRVETLERDTRLEAAVNRGLDAGAKALHSIETSTPEKRTA
jgi:hypothetical protein